MFHGIEPLLFPLEGACLRPWSSILWAPLIARSTASRIAAASTFGTSRTSFLKLLQRHCLGPPQHHLPVQMPLQHYRCALPKRAFVVVAATSPIGIVQVLLPACVAESSLQTAGLSFIESRQRHCLELTGGMLCSGSLRQLISVLTAATSFLGSLQHQRRLGPPGCIFGNRCNTIIVQDR